MATCQRFHRTKPDDATNKHMMNVAASALSNASGTTVNVADDVELVDVVCQSNPDMPVQLDITGLHTHRMASNCGPEFKPTNVTAINRYSCEYYGERVDDKGNVGFNLTDRVTGTFASCDAGGFDSRTEDDIRLLVADQLDNGRFVPDPSKVRCDITSLPA